MHSLSFEQYLYNLYNSGYIVFDQYLYCLYNYDNPIFDKEVDEGYIEAPFVVEVDECEIWGVDNKYCVITCHLCDIHDDVITETVHRIGTRDNICYGCEFHCQVSCAHKYLIVNKGV